MSKLSALQKEWNRTALALVEARKKLRAAEAEAQTASIANTRAKDAYIEEVNRATGLSQNEDADGE